MNEDSKAMAQIIVGAIRYAMQQGADVPFLDKVEGVSVSRDCDDWVVVILDGSVYTVGINCLLRLPR